MERTQRILEKSPKGKRKIGSIQRDAGEGGRKIYSESGGQWRSEDREQKEAWGEQLKLPGVNEPGSYERVHQ